MKLGDWIYESMPEEEEDFPIELELKEFGAKIEVSPDFISMEVSTDKFNDMGLSEWEVLEQLEEALSTYLAETKNDDIEGIQASYSWSHRDKIRFELEIRDTFS